MSNTRMTAERLKEIESATSYESGNPQVQAVYRDLLAELRAVQQERDEAIESRTRAWSTHNEHLNGPYTALQKETHALRAEVAVARERLGPAGYKIIQEVATLRAEVEKLHNSANMWSKAAQNNKDNMDAWASECKALRAENAKLKAVAVSALKDADELARSALSIASRDGADTAWDYFKVRCKLTLTTCCKALAALDAKPGQESR